MQAAKAAAEAAESAALAAEDGARVTSPVEATSKASAAAWRASQAASFEATAEAEALQAASHAKVAGTAQAVAASMEAAQHYNLVRTGLCLALAAVLMLTASMAAANVRQDLASWAAVLLCACPGPACQASLTSHHLASLTGMCWPLRLLAALCACKVTLQHQLCVLPCRPRMWPLRVRAPDCALPRRPC